MAGFLATFKNKKLAKETISNSPDISVLESRIVSDLCLGKFFIDLTPSLFLGAGATNVLGAKIEIVNPYGVSVKPFGAGYDIAPPMTSVFEFNIPTQSGSFQYGVYAIKIELTDSVGNVYDIIENREICQPNPLNKKDLYGILGAKITGSCRKGSVLVFVNEPPIFQGVAYESKTQSYKLEYPTGSLQVPLITTDPNFEVQIYEGEYKLTGDLCVNYNLGNNNFIKVPYKVNTIQPIRCEFDDCPAFNKIGELVKALGKNKCKERDITEAIINSALTNISIIHAMTICGEDPSYFIDQVEKLLGISCRLTIGGTVPINGTPALSVNIVGVNTSFSDAGLTRTYTIDNFEFRTTINPANNTIVSISAPVLGGGIKTQELTFSVSGLYAAMKLQVVNPTEYAYWAGVVKSSFEPSVINLAFLGISLSAYNALTYAEFEQLKLDKMRECCGSATCNAVITNLVASLQGVNTLLTWDNNEYVGSIDIYVDDNFVDNLLNPLLPPNSSSYLLTGYNNSVNHKLKSVPKCVNGINGTSISIEFNFAGCPTILAPSLSANSVPNASCPFNLSTLIFGAVPPGLTLSWHNANNTNAGTLVPNPASVTSGTYFAFYTDINGCNSPSSQVQIVCAMIGNCTEPISLLVQAGAGTTNIITFNSAITPPPSYLVKRRLASDPDVSGSYTTIGTPTFNAGTNKWEITDVNSLYNTLYVYKAESQCSDASRPFANFTFANFTCSGITGGSGSNSVSYLFPIVSGSITQYDVQLYDASATTLLFTDTYTPAFANPITGSFTGLSASTAYKVRLRMHIGLTIHDCPFVSVSTNPPAGTINITNPFILGLTISNDHAEGTITGTPGATVYVRILMSGTDAAAITTYNIDGTVGTITNLTSGLTIPKVLTGGSIDWELDLATTISSQGATIQLV